MRTAKIALFEIILLLLALIAVPYIAGETSQHFNAYTASESTFVSYARTILLNWLSGGLVSAQETLWTCLEDVNGTTCQEYGSDVCNDVCIDTCFPGPREDFSSCQLGTCFDPSEGTCQPNTPQYSCEEAGGEWSEETPGQCNPGCCIIGSQTQYTTETSCSIIGQDSGIETTWEPVANELECILLAEQQAEGACVLEELPEEGAFNCEFTTKGECFSQGGDFHENFLCSHPDLNTVCEKQTSINCAEHKDGLYWFDSCGNRENIYDKNKAASWNDGTVLPISESCELGTDNDPLKNQERCGNCDYALGSICGSWIPGNEHIVDSELGDFVCRDLSCVDEWGNDRRNGESWCAFDSQIGLDNENKKNEERSVDLPGSGHYRKYCLDGEVHTDACADYRGEVCVENINEQIDFSSASCRINQWQQCTAANTDQTKLDQCEEHTDCSLKRIDIDDFEFDICTPKHPPGFDLKAESGGDVGETICSLASQTCTIVEVKRFSGWKCKANCNCEDPEFTEAMNNLCLSLGDCGAHVNIAKEYTDDGYKVRKAPELSASYRNELRDYAEPIEGQTADQLTGKEIAALFGVPESTFENEAQFAEFLGMLGLGATGIVVLTGIIQGGGFAAFSAYVGQVGILQGIGAAGNIGAASLGAFANAAAGAGAGAAIGFLIGKLFGLEGEALDLAVIGGFLSGLGVGIYGAASGQFGFLSFTFLAWTIIITVIIIVIIALLGIGKTREIKVEFSCLPWQPPTGGEHCELCNEDELGCSRYKCNSLGQTCAFINEGTSDELCIDIAPDDVTAPVIGPNEDAIEPPFEYTSITDNGFSIEHTGTEDGCIQEYTPVSFGIALNEPGQCKVDIVHTDNYDEMSEFFDGSNLYKIEHDTIEAMPTLTSLGVSGIDPDRRGDYTMFVRCQDASGNANVQEYSINFCVSPANDITPPTITFDPDVGYAGLNVTEKFVDFYTNEPADCSWSFEDKDLTLMEHNATCINGIEDVTPDGWYCSTILPVTDLEEQPYYFRCLDQPWLGDDDDDENDADRNANTESTIFTIVKTTEPLEITSISPHNETITVASDVGGVPITLEIQTGGGVDGSALCQFSLAEDIYFDFFSTGGITHTQDLSLLPGEYNVGLLCADIAENTATATAEFDIFVDDTGPIISYVYDLGDLLHVITNEPSTCAYDESSCNFLYDNGTLMQGTDLTHTTPLEQGLVYHIKCQDNFGNTGGCLVATGGY